MESKSPAKLAIIISETAQEIFGRPSLPYDPALRFREIPGFDSVRAIQYILAIETAFGITLDEDEVDTMHTMGDLMRVLEGKQAS